MKLWMAPHGLHIEPARVDDAKALAALHAEGFYRGWPVADFTSYLADPDRTPAYVAVDKKRRIVGFAMLRLAVDEAELITIAVTRKWRGKKLGRALMQAIFADLLQSPAKTMFLEVEDANMAAIALYTHLGFVEISRREAYYPKSEGKAAAALVMRRPLD